MCCSGTLPHSGRTRGVLAEAMDQAHLIEAMDGVLRRLGGTPQVWRTDRLATVIVPGTAGRPGQLRPGGQALRGHRRALSAQAGQPQGGGRGGGALHLGPLVADPDGATTPRRPSSASTASGHYW